MALPTSMLPVGMSRVRSGIEVAYQPSTTLGFRVELQYSTGSTLASSQWVSEFLDPTSGYNTHVIELPQSTRTYYLKARHTGVGYAAGAFTGTVSAKPTLLQAKMPDFSPRRNSKGSVEIPGAVYLPSTYTVNVGTQQASSYIVKTLRIHHAETVRVLSTASVDYQTVDVRAGTTAAVSVRGSAVMPKGVTLTQVAARMYRESTADQMTVDFHRVASDAAATLATLTATATGWGTVNSSAMSQLVSDEAYSFLVTINPSAAAADARFQFLELTYRMPAYSRTV